MMESIGIDKLPQTKVEHSPRENLSSGFTTRYDTNEHAQSQLLAKVLKFRLKILVIYVIYYLDTDKQRCSSDCANMQADLCFCC